jgi:predicted dehydrogenase
MGYHEFSSGPIGGWMAHFINFVHFVTGCGYPVTATAHGGRYAPANDPRCDAPDQVTVVLDYAEGFCTQFVTHFGSSIDDESTKFMFEKGTLRTRFGHAPGNPTYSSEGVDDTIPPTKLLKTDPPYPGTAHVENWFQCMRTGELPNAHMGFGHMQGIAVLMGDAAYSQGRKVTYDKESRAIRP